jgi:hypothetical protein
VHAARCDGGDSAAQAADGDGARLTAVVDTDPGAGTLNHLTGESLKLLAGLPDLIHVPY